MSQYKQEIDLYFELKGTPESSIESYTRRIEAFTKHIQEQNICMEELTYKDIQQYIIYLLRERKLSAGSINNYISAVKFFYTYVLGKDWDIKKVPRMKRRSVMPVIPPKEDVLEILDMTLNLKHKAILSLLYGSGLRVSEVAKLRICDICSKTMRVRVEQAKHDTNRYTILSEASLEALRDYFKEYFPHKKYRPDEWLFPGQNENEHINIKTIKNTVIKLRDRLGFDRSISTRTLRHCFATHSLEDGIDVVFIQQMLGHKRIQTTLTYTHMTSKSLMGIRSPLDTGNSK